MIRSSPRLMKSKLSSNDTPQKTNGYHNVEGDPNDHTADVKIRK